MFNYEYVVFDLDGTLLDTSEGIILAVTNTMKEYNRKIPNRKILESLIGPPMQTSFKKLYSISDTEAMEMANVFRKFYMNDSFLLKAIPYEGIYDLIERLVYNKIKIGIATYKREDYAVRLLRANNFDKFTNHMYGSDFAGKLKKEDIIYHCLDKMKCVDIRKAVYIGDSKSDMEAATKAGIDFIAVTYGFGFKDKNEIDLKNAVHICESCKEIAKNF